MISRRKDNCDERDAEEGNVHLSTVLSVELLVETQTTGKVTHAEHEKGVAEYRTNHTRLDEVYLALAKGEDGDQQLDGVTECCCRLVSI